MCDERKALVQAKREEEQSLIKHLITLSSGSIVLLAGIVFSKDASFVNFNNKILFYSGTFSIILSLLLCLCEQKLSAEAYDMQIKINEKFYMKQDLHKSNVISTYVRLCITLSLGLFFYGIVASSTFLVLNSGPKEPAMSNNDPRPPAPSPPREPVRKGDVPGRSVPPSPPPPPPSPRK